MASNMLNRIHRSLRPYDTPPAMRRGDRTPATDGAVVPSPPLTPARHLSWVASLSRRASGQSRRRSAASGRADFQNEIQNSSRRFGGDEETTRVVNTIEAGTVSNLRDSQDMYVKWKNKPNLVDSYIPGMMDQTANRLLQSATCLCFCFVTSLFIVSFVVAFGIMHHLMMNDTSQYMLDVDAHREKAVDQAMKEAHQFQEIANHQARLSLRAVPVPSPTVAAVAEDDDEEI